MRLLAAALAVPVLAAGVGAARAADVAGARVLVLTGRGFGHGVGLSQWGAERRAAAGQPLAAILSFYYPGTQLEQRPTSDVRVLLADGPHVHVGSRAPFTVTGADGRAATVPAGTYAVDRGGLVAARVALPAVVVPGAAPVRLGGTAYAGTLTLLPRDGGVRVVNTLPLEEYLVAVVSSECPGYWPAAALQAQAVASRSYALANLRPGADFDLYPDDRSQNYHGLLRHFPAAAAAVGATRGVALTYDGQVANALFSADNGGYTSVPDALWGGPPLPYFVARPDPYDAGTPGTRWGPVAVSLARVRQAFPAVPAAVVRLQATRNAGGRATRLTFVGADGRTVAVDAYTFQERLGLRSTYFSLSLGR